MRRAHGLTAIAMMVACGNNVTERGFSVIAPNPPDLSPPTQTDRFYQDGYAAVDILWVVDDSCSMQAHQDSLAERFSEFIPYLIDSGLDWHVGVVSTSYERDRGLLQRGWETRWIHGQTDEPEAEFEKMSRLATQGDRQERGRDQVEAMWTLATSRDPTPNVGFYRDEAAFSVIVLSDEDDASTVRDRRDFAEWLAALKPDPSMVSFSSIVGPPGGCSGPNGDAMEGTEYLAVTEAVGGVSASICEDDWSVALDALGARATGLTRTFGLSRVPDPASLQVWLIDEQGRTELDAYAYERVRNEVTLDQTPPRDAAVEVSYQVLDGSD